MKSKIVEVWGNESWTWIASYNAKSIKERESLPLENGKYIIHIKKDPKGNYWLKKDDGIRYKKNKKRMHFCCKYFFVTLFSKSYYNSIPKSWTRYQITFENVT